jgi:hypothetical protein
MKVFAGTKNFQAVILYLLVYVFKRNIYVQT